MELRSDAIAVVVSSIALSRAVGASDSLGRAATMRSQIAATSRLRSAQLRARTVTNPEFR
ncbi:MAG: hypothetical protein ABI180_10925 [Microcoleus sp.]